MNSSDIIRKQYVGYEYKEIAASGEKASFLLDGYECFGWEIDENVLLGREAQYVHSRMGSKTVIRLRRNRKIMNKMELTRLQRNFEACVDEISMLEKAKTSKATVWALGVGIIGTAFMAASVFAITAPEMYIALCILFAFFGFVGWIVPYFLYKRIAEKETERINSLIEEKYDEIYEICEKGNKILM